MTDQEAQSEAPAKPSPADVRQMLTKLPSIFTDLDSTEVAKRAQRQSERGKLPGFIATIPDGLYEANAFGNPFDYRLIANHTPGKLGFNIKIKRKMPIIFWAVMAFTIWPGVIFTDSLLNTWFSWYPNETWKTYAWYIPLTVLPLPWLHKAVMARTRLAALVHAHEQIHAIAKNLGGEVND
jgi:hypothetical protein